MEILTHMEHLVGRLRGPFSLRFIIQPLVAVILAVRAGLKDAREGRPAHLWTIATDPARRSKLLQESWKDVAKVFIMAVVIDIIYEIIVLRHIHPLQSLIVATALALIPYLLIRGPVNRIVRHWWNRKELRQ